MIRLWNIEDVDEIAYMYAKRSENNLGLKIVLCENCGKQFAATAHGAGNLCVFCRLSQPSRSFARLD